MREGKESLQKTVRVVSGNWINRVPLSLVIVATKVRYSYRWGFWHGVPDVWDTANSATVRNHMPSPPDMFNKYNTTTTHSHARQCTGPPHPAILSEDSPRRRLQHPPDVIRSPAPDHSQVLVIHDYLLENEFPQGSKAPTLQRQDCRY